MKNFIALLLLVYASSSSAAIIFASPNAGVPQPAYYISAPDQPTPHEPGGPMHQTLFHPLDPIGTAISLDINALVIPPAGGNDESVGMMSSLDVIFGYMSPSGLLYQNWVPVPWVTIAALQPMNNFLSIWSGPLTSPGGAPVPLEGGVWQNWVWVELDPATGAMPQLMGTFTVPEPGSLPLLLSAFGLLTLMQKRRRPE